MTLKLFLLSSFATCGRAVTDPTDAATGPNEAVGDEFYNANDADTHGQGLAKQSGQSTTNGAGDVHREEVSSLLPPNEVSYHNGWNLIMAPGQVEMTGVEFYDDYPTVGITPTAAATVSLPANSTGDATIHQYDPWPKCNGDDAAKAACALLTTQGRIEWSFAADGTAHSLTIKGGGRLEYHTTGEAASAACIADLGSETTRLSYSSWYTVIDGSSSGCGGFDTSTALSTGTCGSGSTIKWFPARENNLLDGACLTGTIPNNTATVYVVPTFFNSNRTVWSLATPITVADHSVDAANTDRCAAAGNTMKCDIPAMFTSAAGASSYTVKAFDDGGNSCDGTDTSSGGDFTRGSIDGCGGSFREYDYDNGYLTDTVVLSPPSLGWDSWSDFSSGATLLPEEVVCRCKTKLWLDVLAEQPVASFFVELNPYGPSLTSEGSSSMSGTIGVYRDSGFSLQYTSAQGALPRSVTEFFIMGKTNTPQQNVQITNLLAAPKRENLANSWSDDADYDAYVPLIGKGCAHTKFNVEGGHGDPTDINAAVADGALTYDATSCGDDSSCLHKHKLHVRKFRFEGYQNVWFGARLTSCEPGTLCTPCLVGTGTVADFETAGGVPSPLFAAPVNTIKQTNDDTANTRRRLQQQQSKPDDATFMAEVVVGDDAPTLREVITGESRDAAGTQAQSAGKYYEMEKSRKKQKKASATTDAEESGETNMQMYLIIGSAIVVLLGFAIFAVNRRMALSKSAASTTAPSARDLVENSSSHYSGKYTTKVGGEKNLDVL